MTVTTGQLNGVGHGNVSWPFSFGVWYVDGLNDSPAWSDIAFGPAKIVSFGYESITAFGAERPYLKIYNKSNVEPGVDAPAVVLPVYVGGDSNIDKSLPFMMFEDGVPGMYFDNISMVLNMDPGTGKVPYVPSVVSTEVFIQTTPVS